MGGGNGGDGASAQHRGVTDGKGMEHVLNAGDPVLQLPAGAVCGQNGQGRALRQGLQSRDMIGMGMGDENGIQRLGRQIQLPQGGSDPAAGDAGVQQDPGGVAAKQQRVSGGTAGQGMYGGQKNFPRSK